MDDFFFESNENNSPLLPFFQPDDKDSIDNLDNYSERQHQENTIHFNDIEEAKKYIKLKEENF